MYARDNRSSGEAGDAPASGEQEVATPRHKDKERKRYEAALRNEHHREVKPLKDQIAAIERRIAEVEAGLVETAKKMVDPALFEDSVAMREVYSANASLEDEQVELLERWETLGTELEAADEALRRNLEDVS